MTSSTLLEQYRQAMATFFKKTSPKNSLWLEAQKIADNHEALLKVAGELASSDAETRSKAFESARFMFPKALNEFKTESEAYAKAADMVNKAVKDSEDIVQRELKSLSKSPAGMSSAAEPVEKEAGLIRRIGGKIIDTHNTFIDKRSETGRFLISNAEILLGSVLTVNGGYLMIHSLRRGELAPQEDANGNIRLAMAALPSGQRFKEAAGGAVRLAAGLGLLALGFTTSRRY